MTWNKKHEWNMSRNHINWASVEVTFWNELGRRKVVKGFFFWNRISRIFIFAWRVTGKIKATGRVYFIDKKIINIVATYSIVVQKTEVKHVVFQWS
jgi:hypothetical protein